MQSREDWAKVTPSAMEREKRIGFPVSNFSFNVKNEGIK